MQLEILRNPWTFATLSAVLIGIVTYVWAQLTNKQQSAKMAGSSFVIAVSSLLLLTWVAHGSQNSVMTEPFPTA